MDVSARSSHIVIIGVEAWGHAKPLAGFAARVALRGVYVTFFTTARVYERLKEEIACGFQHGDAEARQLIRLVALDTTSEDATLDRRTRLQTEHNQYIALVTSAYRLLLGGQPVACIVSKITFPGLPAPRVVIVTPLSADFAKPIAALSQSRAKIILLATSMTAYTYVNYAPLEKGGRGDFKDQVLLQSRRTGTPPVEVADDLVHTYTDDVYQPPGLPKMHHYEFDPQDTSFTTRGILAHIFLELYELYKVVDGIILNTPEIYEPEAVRAFKEWFAESNRSVWALGPLSPAVVNRGLESGNVMLSSESNETTQFMYGVLTRYGEHSILYISFGSYFWPTTETVEAFVDVVLEKHIPFILTYGAPLAELSDSLRTKVEQSNLGRLIRWSPQQIILAHPALGWFVTHCGHNSTLEAIAAGVPMICWPMGSDQPLNAVHLTEDHDVAYELMEVRNGNGLKPIYRTGKAHSGSVDAIKEETRVVLAKAFGVDGQKKRMNVKKLKNQVDEAWKKGGPADLDMDSFVQTCLS